MYKINFNNNNVSIENVLLFYYYLFNQNDLFLDIGLFAFGQKKYLLGKPQKKSSSLNVRAIKRGRG